MKKIIILFIILMQYLNGISQANISSAICLEDNLYLRVFAIDTLKNDVIVVGEIQNKTQYIFQPEQFIARLNATGNLIWIKKIKMSYKIIDGAIRSLSNNTFLIKLVPLIENETTYCLDANGNELWNKVNLDIEEIIDLPNEKAFITNFMVKMKYDGTLVWAKSFLANIGIYERRLAKFDNNTIAYAIEIGDLTSNGGRLDSIAVLKISTNDGSIQAQSAIFGVNNDTLSLSSIGVVNNKIIIVGGTGLYNTQNSQDKDKVKGFVTVLNNNLNLLWAKKLYGQDNKKYFNVSSIFSSYDNNLILVCRHNLINYTNPIIKMSLGNGQIDSIVLIQAQSVGVSDKSNQNIFATSNAFALGYYKPTNIFNPTSCLLKRENVISQNFTLKSQKSNLIDFDPITLSLSNTNPLNFSNILTKSYDSCPECGCPQIKKTKQIICEGKFYQTKSGKKVSQTGIVIDTTSNPVSGCLLLEEIDLEVNTSKKTQKSFVICQANPNITIASKTYNKAGNYQDTLKSVGGCDSILTITIKDLKDLSVSLGEDKEIFEGNDVILKAETNHQNSIENFVWLPKGTTSCDTCQTIKVAPTQNQLYIVKAQKDGCSVYDSILVKVLKEKLVFMPTIFSPNDDNINDIYRPFSNEAVEKIDYFYIYDRWGTEVFKQENIAPNQSDLGWDGTYKGVLANSDIYLYAVQIRLRNGQTQKYVGDFKLMREK